MPVSPPLNLCCNPTFACFQTSMPLIKILVTQNIFAERLIREKIFNILMERRLIAFQRQYIIPFFFNNLLRNSVLTLRLL
jgi:hypothetical protein